uniref:Uncharacterized protein SYNPCC7002_A1590 n=1 Tax=Anthurium amnicola TaxID=1678845 RepID=A0A1D1Y1X1_9ARAE
MQEEWRVQMLPMQILFASVNPVVVMRLRCKSQGRGYPPEVPTRVTRLLELRAVSCRCQPRYPSPVPVRAVTVAAGGVCFVFQTRWELQGLEGGQVPSHFVLDVQGLLYPDRGEGGPPRSRLRGHLQTSISFVLPPVLALVPENALREVAESVLRTLAKRMKQEVDGSLLTDFQNFRRERLKKHLINERVARYPRVHADPNPKADSQKRTP